MADDVFTNPIAPPLHPGCTCYLVPHVEQAIIDEAGQFVQPLVAAQAGLTPPPIAQADTAITNLSRRFDNSYVQGTGHFEDPNTNLFMQYDNRSRQIEVNQNADWTQYWNIPNFRVGQSTGLPPQQVAATHEFGHSLEQSLTNTEWRELAETVNNTAAQKVLALEHRDLAMFSAESPFTNPVTQPQLMETMKTWIGDNVSRYGATSAHEFLAEAFAEGELVKNPRAIAKAVHQFFRRVRPA